MILLAAALGASAITIHHFRQDGLSVTPRAAIHATGIMAGLSILTAMQGLYAHAIPAAVAAVFWTYLSTIAMQNEDALQTSETHGLVEAGR